MVGGKGDGWMFFTQVFRDTAEVGKQVKAWKNVSRNFYKLCQMPLLLIFYLLKFSQIATSKFKIEEDHI